MHKQNCKGARPAALLGILAACLSLIPSPVLAWGGQGHSFAAALAVRSLPEGPLKDFWKAHEVWLAEYSSYPDRWRNRPDAAENPRHFLDGENFGVGTDLTKIPRPFGDTLKVRTYEQLRTDGTVPWTVDRHYKLLVDALREKRWKDAMIQTAYMSHYIADSHVPFHASANYDGQLSMPSQKGIHSRFESQMVERSIRFQELKSGEPLAVSDPIAFTFDVLQESIDLVPRVLEADKAAVARSNGEYNDAYWEAFTPATRPIAVERLERAGRALAGLMVAAWKDARKPELPRTIVDPNDLLPYAPLFTPRGTTAPPTPPRVDAWLKEIASQRVQTIAIPSKLLGRETQVNLILPADYATSGQRYSVLYLLHGATGSYKDWANSSAIAAYTVDRPLIVVMPDAGGDSFYLNSKGKGQIADYMIRELIPAIDRKYRTIAQSEGRAIAGLSMGGYGAWKLALDNPGTFACAASLSGALGYGVGDWSQSEGGRRFLTGIYGEIPAPANFAKDALLPRLESLVGEGGRWLGPNLYFDIGKEDFLLDSNHQMEAELLKRRIPFEFAEFNGKHDWAYWDEHIQDVLQFVQRQVSEPRR